MYAGGLLEASSDLFLGLKLPPRTTRSRVACVATLKARAAATELLLLTKKRKPYNDRHVS